MRNQNPLRQQRGLWLSIVPALVLALALGGCALNSTGLPGNLPIPPGGGTLTISRSTLVNGITGRTYTIWIPTSGGTGTLSSCTIIAGTLPAGLSIAISDDSTNAPPVTAVRFCKITGTISTAGPTTVNFTVQAADTATPANTASQAFTIFVRPEFTVTTATAFLDGRQNDHYGDPAEAKTPQPVVTDVSATVGNAPLNATAGVGCVFTIVGNPGFNLTPAPTSGNTCALSSGATPLAAAGAFTVTLAATDTDLMDTFAGQTTKIVVPRNAISSVALSLTVNPPVTATFNQAGNTVAASTLLDGVDARSYGTINAGAGAPTWSVTGGLGAGAAGLANYSWCVSAGGASVTAVGLTGISTSCAAPTAGVNSVSLTSAAVVQGSASFSVDVTDAGNAAVISRTITQGTSVINALAQLAGSFVQGVVTPNTNANSTLLDGVNAQSYGVINANAGAPTYAATGGLGVGTAGAAAYQWCVSAGGATVTAIGLAGISTNCAAPTTGTPVLLSTASAVTGAASFAVDLSDTGNAATPPAPNITFGTSTITVYSDFLATFNQSGNTNPASTLLPGVNTRSYGVIGGGAGAPTWTAAAGLGSGTAGATNYQWCVSAGAASVTATALGGISTNCAAPTTGASVTLTSASATTGAAVFSVDATDAGNEAVPSVTITQGTSTININPDLAVALQAVPASPDPTTPAAQAVVGRTYGAPLADVVYEVIGGLPAYVITPSGTLTTDTNIVCVSGATTSTCNSAGAGVTNTGGLNPSLTISATDTANAATPAAPAPATKTDVWTVNPAITFSLLPGPTGAAPNGVIPDGVVGRQYGTPLGTNDLVFTASGGLGNTAGFGLTGTASGTLLANGVSCSPATPQVGASVSVTCNSGGGVTTLSAPTGARTFVMTFSDAGNSTTPLGSTNTDSAGFTNYSNNVNAPLTVALQTVPASPDPTTAAGQAVEGRTYGAPAKTDVVYEVTGGLPAAAPPLYTITPSGTLTTDTNIVCTAGSTTATCNSGGAAVTNTGGVNPSLTISATDTSNALTPAAAAAATKTDTWTVNPPITFSLVPGATGVAPNGTIPDGVVGRQYGTPLGANDLVFTASGGLGNTAGFGLTGAATGTFVTDSGLICAPAGAQVGASVSVTCNSGGGVSTLGGTAGAKTLVMTFSDAGNSTTPTASTNTDTTGYTNYANAVQAALALALQAGSPDPANVNAQAVVGRTYGSAPEAPVVYETTGGLPGYTFTTAGTLLANSNICAVPVIAATTLTCNSGGVGVAGTSGSLTVTTFDTANATTPQGSVPLVKAYTVNPAVSLTATPVTPDPELASSTAVVGRLYGVPAGLASPTFTATGGLSLYTFVHGGTLEANTNIVCTDATPTVTCESAVPVTGTAPFPQTEPFTLQVTDGGNLTTPADPVGDTVTKNFTLNDALAITTVTLRNGLVDFTYVPTGPGETIVAAGGLGGNTWVAPGGGGGGCAPAGVLPFGLTLGAASGLLSGIPTTASPTPLDYAFDVCVFDTANATTPSGNSTASYTVNIMDPLAAVAQPGSDTVEGINTKTNLSIGPVAMPAASFPTAVAVTPDGRKAYVTLNAADDVAVIDTITGTVSLVGGLGTCVGPQGIAIGMPGGLPTAFVACSNGEVAVIDAATDTFVASGPFGTQAPITADFYGVAFTPDESLVYVTDAANDEFVVLDAISVVEIFGSPFAAGVTAPHGILISADQLRVYIAGSLSDDVIVLDTADNTTVVAGPIAMGLGSGPEALAVTPDGAHVYVTLTGADAFAVIDDTLPVPALFAGTPVALALASSPWGVTIPPLLVVPGTGFRVYIAQFSLNNVAIRDDELVTPFGPNAASPIALTPPASLPMGIAHIPVPR